MEQSIKSRVIVLNAWRYSDDKILADCLSETAGRITFAVRISHSRRAAVRHTLFQPLAILEMEWNARARGGIVTPKSATMVVAYTSLLFDPNKQAVVLFLAEALHHITRNEDDASPLYAYVENSLRWFDTAEKGFANFHIVFLMRLSLFLGITPNLEECHLPYFDLMTAEFLLHAPQHSYFISGEETQAFAQLMRMNYGTMQLFRLSRQQRQRILDLVLLYYRLHLPTMPELKSLSVLHEVFS